MFYLWVGVLVLLILRSISEGELGACFVFAFLIAFSFLARNAYSDGVNSALESAHKKAQKEEEERRIRQLTLEKLESEKSNRNK